MAVRWRRFSSLPGEICLALQPAEAGSASRSNTAGDRTEVSRGHTTEITMNRGAERCPCKQRDPQAQLRKDRTNIGEPTRAPTRNSNRRAAL